MSNREAIAEALLARLAGVTWVSSVDGQVKGFLEVSRRVKLFGDAQQKPSLFLAQGRENIERGPRMLRTATMAFSVIIYHDVGRDIGAIPAKENNAIIDAIEAALNPTMYDQGFPDYNTLGNLVHSCSINGSIQAEPGDLDGEAMIVIPIVLIVP